MCTRFIPPEQAEIERHWQIGRQNPQRWWRADVFPRRPGPFIRLAKEAAEPELVIGQWALVPHFAKSKTLPYATNNARIETVPTAASYKQPWARGQRCIIPAEAYWEPCWETGKNVWWAFRRADSEPWGLAGLWNTWTDHATGEIVETFAMITQNADAHPLMNRMHKPDPKLPPDKQDKRSVVAIERANFEQWLCGTVDEAKALIKLTPAETIDARAER